MVLAVLGILGVAAAAAVSITSEREQDTWTSLMPTLLTPAEIVRAKQFGAVWSVRRVGLALLIIWAAGILLRALHPVGVLAAAVSVMAIAWLIAAVGVFASSLAKNSSRALVTTFTALLIVSGLGPWPLIVWISLSPHHGFSAPPSQTAQVFATVDGPTSVVASGSLVALCALVAALLTLVATRRLRTKWGR
jgi:hypothetical protein